MVDLYKEVSAIEIDQSFVVYKGVEEVFLVSIVELVIIVEVSLAIVVEVGVIEDVVGLVGVSVVGCSISEFGSRLSHH